jgi:hypothetical protein
MNFATALRQKWNPRFDFFLLAILIIWDRMFGTFQPELFRPTCGLTRPVGTYNLVNLQYGHYADLWRDVREATSWRDRFGYLFMPPD